MIIIPAIDLYDKKAVRLLCGDYNQMTVYSENPVAVALGFAGAGAKYIHIVDLEGARDGSPANFETIREIIKTSGLFAEVGGGIRTKKAIEKYLEAGAGRAILGTAALEDFDFLRSVVREYGDKIAVGVDIKDGRVALRGWRETSETDCYTFCERLQVAGVRTIICTDISKDGAMRGTNRELYRELSRKFNMNIIASGGVSTLDDVVALSRLGIYGAIIGRALYTGDINLKEALEAAI
ncbi:MAG TPA: 1-(5-phosphoribosyl)-5-[(5-phosphoribosylamino)methylideneamino]imidazole-4-carboxamide isomerase [Clostridiales bacterium]|jgi:phosphoribosylformimino-5-aminoimidazole carboxamide ribotide isomerase|nr:1-(5-phosphoribosyl)-5-[(5-phosphoribosylamino)methylideneamino]imidazole-4-carboxamide isomerase [Clostridiales bacterium]